MYQLPPASPIYTLLASVADGRISGFPDSWVLWQSLLTSLRLAHDSTLVAVDLPGYGGSDDLEVHDAEGILEAMTEFILGMRERHPGIDGDGERKVFIVAHDWGSIVAFRLAAEAPQLADRFVITSAVLVRR
jgi:pimeloyl-ACP methyl ester carboxylesterase